MPLPPSFKPHRLSQERHIMVISKLALKPVKLSRDYKGLTVTLERNNDTGKWEWSASIMTRTTYSDEGFEDSDAAFKAAQYYLDVLLQDTGK